MRGATVQPRVIQTTSVLRQLLLVASSVVFATFQTSGAEPLFVESVPPGSTSAPRLFSLSAPPCDENRSSEFAPDWLNDADLRRLTVPFDVREWEKKKHPRFRLRGRLEEDTLAATQNAANVATFGKLTDVTGFRRARVGAEGNFTPDSRYIFEIDLASGQVVLRDGFVAVGDLEQSGEFRAGHMREPFSLEGATSSNTFAFMERSLINGLDPARNWGISYNHYDAEIDRTFDVGLFAAGTDSSDIQFGSTSNSALTAKVTKAFRDNSESQRLMHVGLALSERIADFGTISIQQKPNSPLIEFGDSTQSPFVPTITLAADFEQLINAQWAMVNGPFWAQSEWYGIVVPQRGDGPVFLHGSYLDVGYFLTGESRSYLFNNGSFGPVSVRRPAVYGFSNSSHDTVPGHGAWEIVGRVSYLDYTNGNLPPGPAGQTQGVQLPQFTVGLNWYLADRLRVMFNYSYYAPLEPNTGTSAASIFGTRFAMYW